MNDEELIKETMMLDYSQLVMHNVYMIKENKRLENIIKEVREYCMKYENWEDDCVNDIMKILDKTN